MARKWARKWTAALLAGASLAAVGSFTTDGFARGGGHFGGGFGGGHFGGGRFEGREFRPQMREPHFDRERVRPEEMHRPEEHRGEDAARHRDEHPDRDQARDQARDHREDLDRAQGDRRDLAARDLRTPANNGHFYRNAFWGNQFGAHDFNCRNCRWGWAGNVFWPFAFGDFFAFAWWPYAGTPAFWNYGLNYIVTGLFWPYGAYQWPEGYGAYAWSDDGGTYQYGREARQEVYSSGPADGSEPAEGPASSADLAQSCAGFAPGVGSLPVDRIAQAVKPDAQQQRSFDELKSASAKAEAVLKGACPSEPPLTPVGRLDALQKRLDAMLQAVDVVKKPMADFTKSLSEEQRKALDGLSTSGSGPAMEKGDLGGCVDEGQEFVELPAQEIAQSVQPDAKQSAALDQLESVTAKAAERLRSGCPASVPATPEARLEAMDQRLQQTLVAVNEVRPALVDFYQSLTDEQKARFNTLPPQHASRQP